MVQSVAAAIGDWSAVVRVATRHRITGLVAESLRMAGVTLPQEAAARLSRREQQIVLQNLAFASETHRVLSGLDSAGVDALVVKGVALNLLAYGTLGLKEARDVDILIPPESIDAALAAMAALGYRRIIPDPMLEEARARTWITICKESAWVHDASACLVELHTGLADNPTMIPNITARSPRQTVTIGAGLAVATLRDEELFSYLCVHGAAHGWARLKWLADLAAFLSHRSPAEREALYRRSVELGAGRSSAQALLLCIDLFDLDCGSGLERELRSDRVSAWLADHARRRLSSGRYAERELDSSAFGTVWIQFSHFLLGRGLRHKRAELKQKLFGHHTPVALPLPRPLRFLYPLLSIPHWGWRRWKLISPKKR